MPKKPSRQSPHLNEPFTRDKSLANPKIRSGSLNHARKYLGVDALRVGHAAAVLAVVALVDVDAALPVRSRVIEAHALNGGTREAGRARVAAEPVHQVHAARADRVARARQIALFEFN